MFGHESKSFLGKVDVSQGVSVRFSLNVMFILISMFSLK
ncbi:Hypothetical protein Cp262_1228 [Corynebacterium pseudotuberculosis]|nr:Hypothetical protein Cp262_1228 [Corynebacterium pseudotuberculosis]